MEESSSQTPPREVTPQLPVKDRGKTERAEVITVRTWKEYVGESLLIVFSVLFALLLTEIFNNIHEKQHTREILKAVRTELQDNMHKEQEQYQYHLQVLRNIDSALADPAFQKQFINNGVINLTIIAPQGVSARNLDDIAWQVARQADIFSKLDLSDYSLLTNIYYNQSLINRSEDLIGNLLLSRESRTAADNRITLILMKENYHAWAVDRAPALLANYQKAIDALKKYD
jgi:hypothetical protein